MARSAPLGILALLKIEALLLLSVCIGNYDYFTKPRNHISCDTTNSSIVRKFVEKNWSKLLHRHGVSLPIDCPLHSHRDLFGDREKAKQARSSHWECRKCGKKFFHEHYLDLHLERKHSDITNVRDDSVCLGDYCDVLRCSVLQGNSILADEPKSTDISLWVPNNRSTPNIQSGHSHSGFDLHKKTTAHTSDAPNATSAQCDEELFAILRKKCEDLVWSCMQGLINTLDSKDFKTARSELESGVCSFLSCDRYAEMSGPPDLGAPLRPFLLVFGSLLISLCLAVAYYLAWIYSQSPDELRSPDSDSSYRYSSHKGKDHLNTYNSNLVNRTTRI